MKRKLVLMILVAPLTLFGCANNIHQAPKPVKTEVQHYCEANGGSFISTSNECKLEDGNIMDATVYFQDHQPDY
ncbi:hypothetical protein [Vibrio mediterranei]|nr:hypothetical protein [Vibrio mediterranei]MCY9854461.1 hypothetical protein [Vibrio mediterranei]